MQDDPNWETYSSFQTTNVENELLDPNTHKVAAVHRVPRGSEPDSPQGGVARGQGTQRGTGDPAAHSSRLRGGGVRCPAASLTIRGTAAFGRRVRLVGIWGTVGLQSPFSLFFLVLIVHSATT